MLHRELGDAWGIAFSLLMYAYAVGQGGDWRQAQELYSESAQRFRKCGDEHYALRASRSLAWAYYEGGDLEHARMLLEDNLRQGRATDDDYVQAISLSQLADVAVDQGRFEEAVSMLAESHLIFRELNDLLYIAAVVGQFARVLAPAGRAVSAAEVLSSSKVQMEEIGASPAWFAKHSENTLDVIRTELDETAFADAWERGRALSADEAVSLALDSFASVS